MTKVVYNGCYGGFSLSEAALKRGRELSGNPEWGGYAGRDVCRHDHILVRVVEELGGAANGSCAVLCIEELPDGTQYRIDEYDGKENVETRDSVAWETTQ